MTAGTKLLSLYEKDFKPNPRSREGQRAGFHGSRAKESTLVPLAQPLVPYRSGDVFKVCLFCGAENEDK